MNLIHSLKASKPTLDNLPSEIPIFKLPNNKIVNLVVDKIDLFTKDKTFRETMEPLLQKGQWYLLASIIDKNAIYFANGWNFVHWIAKKTPDSPSPFGPDFVYIVFRSKLTTTFDNKIQLQWKLLFHKREIEPIQNCTAMSFLAGTDPNLSANVRKEHCRLISEAKKGKLSILPILGDQLTPVSSLRWLERAMYLGDASAANLLGSEIMRRIKPDDFTDDNPAVLLAKRCFEQALKILSRNIPEEALRKDPDYDNGPFASLCKILKEFPEENQVFQDSLSLVYNLEIFYQMVQSNNSNQDIDLNRTEVLKNLSDWFQSEESVAVFENLILEDSRKVSEVSSALLMSMILIHDMYEEKSSNIIYLIAAKRCLDRAIEILNEGPVPQSQKYDILAANLTSKDETIASRAKDIYLELTYLFCEKELYFVSDLNMVEDSHTFRERFTDIMNAEEDDSEYDKNQVVIKFSHKMEPYKKTKIP